LTVSQIRERGLVTDRTFPYDIVVAEIVGYDVEALDGSIGEVDEPTDDLDASFFAVKTGPWIFSKRVVLPLMTVDRVDHDAEKVYVARTKGDIRDAPEYDEWSPRGDHCTALNDYYGTGRNSFRNRGTR
jgi:hypothetical protein